MSFKRDDFLIARNQTAVRHMSSRTAADPTFPGTNRSSETGDLSVPHHSRTRMHGMRCIRLYRFPLGFLLALFFLPTSCFLPSDIFLHEKTESGLLLLRFSQLFLSVFRMIIIAHISVHFHHSFSTVKCLTVQLVLPVYGVQPVFRPVGNGSGDGLQRAVAFELYRGTS